MSFSYSDCSTRREGKLSNAYDFQYACSLTMLTTHSNVKSGTDEQNQIVRHQATPKSLLCRRSSPHSLNPNQGAIS